MADFRGELNSYCSTKVELYANIMIIQDSVFFESHDYVDYTHVGCRVERDRYASLKPQTRRTHSGPAIFLWYFRCRFSGPQPYASGSLYSG